MAIHIQHLPKLEHGSPFFRDGWICGMLCGQSGCGKTSLMAEITPGISDKIRFIIIATLVYDNPFHLALRTWANTHGRICEISDSPDRIRSFVLRLKEIGLLVPGTCEVLLIFDDFAIHNRCRRNYDDFVVEAFTRWRNFGVNLLVVCQDATMVAPSCRGCLNMRILFKTASKTMKDVLNKDLAFRVSDPDLLSGLFNYITNVDYSYLLIQESPLVVSVGKGTSFRRVMSATDVDLPTYRDLMAELGVHSASGLRAAGAAAQKEIGNSAWEISEILET